MNREIKRRLKREQDSSDRLARVQRPPAPGKRRDRVKTRQFIREVQMELRRVIWPTRAEVMTYSVVVVVVVVILTAVVFAMDFGFAKGVFELFTPERPPGAARPPG